MRAGPGFPWSLRTRLLLGYLLFVAALVALGCLGALELSQLGGVSRHILADNYESVVAAQEMKESLERQDSAALFALLGQRSRAIDQRREHRARFDGALARAARNITEPGEAGVVASIREARDLYERRLDQLMRRIEVENADQNPLPLAGLSESYFETLEPVLDVLRRRCDHLLQLNQQAMLAKSRRAETVARNAFVTTLVASGLLVAVAVGLAVVLSASIVRPIRQLTAAAVRVGSGDLDAEAPPLSRDEVGRLAFEFNRMTAHLRELRRSDLGRLIVAQRTAEAAIESLYDPVVVTDEKGRVTRLNRAAEGVFGPESNNRGRPVKEITRDDRLSMAVAETLDFQRAVAGEGAASVLPLVVEGREHAFRLRTTPMRMDDGTLVGAVALLEDITHLREIDRLKSEFVATASHELRTPLSSLVMGVRLLEEGAGGRLGATQLAVVRTCREECERLERLIRDLLELSSIEAGRQRPVATDVSAASLVRTAAESLRSQVESAGQLFQLAVPPDLPEVAADRGQIERVLSNLVSNAVRNTPSGGCVRIAAERREGHVAVSVSDTGRGIPRDDLPRIFDKFNQVPGSVPGGAGLGLSICREIVMAHEGQISVQSEVGRGTVVTFTLPATRRVDRAVAGGKESESV